MCYKEATRCFYLYAVAKKIIDIYDSSFKIIKSIQVEESNLLRFYPAGNEMFAVISSNSYTGVI